MSHGAGKYDVETAAAGGRNRNADIGNGDHYEMASESVPTSPMTPSATDENRPLLRRSFTPASAVRDILTSQKSMVGSEGQGDVADTPADDGDIALGTRTLFCQMDILCHFDDNSTGWKESARWLKYEEKVEDVGRWSKPHVSIAYLHALHVIYNHIKSGTAVLELDLQGMDGSKQKLADVVVSKLRKEKNLSEDACNQLRDILVGSHKHAHRVKDKVKGDRSSEFKQGSDSNLNGDAIDENRNKKGQKRVYEHNLYPGTLTPHQMKPYEPNKNLMKKLPSSSEVANILVGHVTFLSEPIIVFLRLEKAVQFEDMSEITAPTRFLFVYLGPPPASASIKEYEEIGRAAATLLTDKVFCEVAYKAIDAQDILYGIEEYLDEVTVLPPSVWDPSVRLAPPKQTRALNKIANRLEDKTKHVADDDEGHGGGGAASDETLARTGKLFGGFRNDVKRRYSLYWSDIRDAFHVQSIAAVIFLFFACITPIVTFGGMMGQATDNYMGTMECILAGTISGVLYHTLSAQPLTIVGATGPLLVFETILYVFSRDYGIEFLPFRFWVGFWVSVILIVFVAFDLSFLVAYITRFTEEAFACLISIIFIYEAIVNLLKIIGSHPVYVDRLLHNRSYGCLCVPQSNVSHGLSTTLAYTTTAAAIVTSSHGVNATTPAPMVVYSLADWTQRVSESCVTYLGHVVVETGCISESTCTNHGWDLQGDACNIRSVTQAVPDVFFLSWLLALGTLGMAISLKNFRNSPFFPSIVRSTVSDFAVFLAIVSFTLVDYYFRLDTPKLLVPNEVKTTRPDRSWLVNPVGISQPYLFIPLAIIPAALAVILIFLDHQITSVIINRAEHKLKKGGGYHLDLATVSLLVLVCSILGLPWFVAATVRSLNHVRSLMKESEVRIPGEKPQFIGVREQRVTGTVIHILIGLSALLTSVLQLVPMPVLYGVFLYMGISSLAGVQFIQRIMLMFMPSKFQPDYAYLRHVKLTRVHIFTLLQILCMAGMWIVKSIKAISIGFPIMVLALCVMRKAMDYIFTQHELFWLDHLLPEQERRRKEDEEEEIQDKQATWETEGQPAVEYGYTGGARKKSMDIINRRISRDHGGGLVFKPIDE